MLNVKTELTNVYIHVLVVLNNTSNLNLPLINLPLILIKSNY